MTTSDSRPMTPDQAPGVDALARRLGRIAPILRGDAPPRTDGGVDGATLASLLIDELVRKVQEELTDERVWLLLVGLSGRYPTLEEVDDARRLLEIDGPAHATITLLDWCFHHPGHGASCGRDLEILTGQVLLEVDHAARHDLHTGIQQVIRSTAPGWRRHGTVAAAWFTHGRGLRPLSETEERRVYEWTGFVDADEADAPETRTLLVPWRSVIVLPDAPRADAVPELMAIGSRTGNRLVMIGYDCIPVVSPHLVAANAASGFAQFLGVVKHVRRIAAISESARAEYQGFVDTLAVQGLPAATVVTCPLPEAEPGPHDAAAVDEQPLVLMIGSFEERKNQLAVLYAARILWREGLRFRLEFIGGSTSGPEVFDLVRRLGEQGYPVTARHAVPQADVDRALATARFLVLPSLHEGYGLPVAEAFAHGTPVLTSNFGSLAQISAAGGAVTVDPRDDLAITAAMRDLLTDDELIQRLRAEVAERPRSSWADYAATVWEGLIRPELEALSAAPPTDEENDA